MPFVLYNNTSSVTLTMINNGSMFPNPEPAGLTTTLNPIGPGQSATIGGSIGGYMTFTVSGTGHPNFRIYYTTWPGNPGGGQWQSTAPTDIQYRDHSNDATITDGRIVLEDTPSHKARRGLKLKPEDLRPMPQDVARRGAEEKRAPEPQPAPVERRFRRF
ncbi:hypothetical protein TWF696_004183 [Orbilia brochopaga]|uniref:Uncharacterized protein n=1 Tax=Orbilia brochopaga TaxID=3140254 RepID=A0AAV9V5D3_9PEZI